MKIALFTDTFTPLVDGVVTSTISLAKNLADKNHKIYIIAPSFKEKFKEFKYPNIKVKRIYSIPAFFYSGYRFTYPFSFKILNYLKKERIELIHFQTPVALGLQAILISKVLDLPLVGTFHTLFTHPHYRKHMKVDYKPIEKIAWAYARMFYNKCNLVTCPSQETKKELLKHGLKKPIKVISNGIDFRVFKNKKSKLIKKRYNKNGKLLLFVGRIGYEKNLDLLMDSFNIVLKTFPKTKLLIVGDGPQMRELKEKIHSLNIEDRVILTGRIEHDDLVKSSIFKACDLFVTASATETQGITLLEAQANGLVCVAINKGGVKDVIKNGVNGYLTKKNKKDLSEKIIKLLSNDKLMRKMRENTLKEIKNNSMYKIVRVWEEEYSKLISSFNKRSKVYREEHIPSKESF